MSVLRSHSRRQTAFVKQGIESIYSNNAFWHWTGVPPKSFHGRLARWLPTVKNKKMGVCKYKIEALEAAVPTEGWFKCILLE